MDFGIGPCELLYMGFHIVTNVNYAAGSNRIFLLWKSSFTIEKMSHDIITL